MLSWVADRIPESRARENVLPSPHCFPGGKTVCVRERGVPVHKASQLGTAFQTPREVCSRRGGKGGGKGGRSAGPEGECGGKVETVSLSSAVIRAVQRL